MRSSDARLPRFPKSERTELPVVHLDRAITAEDVRMVDDDAGDNRGAAVTEPPPSAETLPHVAVKTVKTGSDTIWSREEIYGDEGR